MPDLKFSIRVNNDLPVADYPRLAQAAERVGFSQFWVSDDLFLLGVWPILTACALATERIELGTCIVNPYTLHPAEMAMQAGALDEVSQGRFNLGISAGAGEFLRWVGLDQPRPYSRTRKAVHQLRALFAGDTPEPLPDRSTPWTKEAYLRFPTRRIPIYLGAMSPRMQRLIGSHADGGLPLLFPPSHFTTVRTRVAQGAASVGRALKEVDLAACIWISVAPERLDAEQVLREKIAYYGQAFSDEILQRLGVPRSAFGPISRLAHTEGNRAAAADLVTPEMLACGVYGSPVEVRHQLVKLVEMGAQHLSFGPPLGPDPLAAIQLLGEEVLPALAA